MENKNKEPLASTLVEDLKAETIEQSKSEEAPKLRKWTDLSTRPVAEGFSDSEAERSRLEREVIEAAKKYRLAVREHMEYAKECMSRDRAYEEEADPKWDAQLGAQCTTEHALSIAVDALIVFESSQQQEQLHART